MKDDLTGIKRLIHLRGYRLTTPRKLILEEMEKAGRQLGADELYLSLNRKGRGVGLATIYRAVDHLTRAGIVRKLSLGAERCVFELMGEGTCGHHHNLMCRKCRRVIAYSDFSKEEVSLIRRLEGLVAKRHKFRVEDHQISFTGLCSSCAK